MVSVEIVEGIRMALSRGQSVQQAMASFINAGYPEADVREAAGIAQSGQQAPIQQPTSVQPQAPVQPMPQPTQQIQQPVAQQPPPQPALKPKTTFGKLPAHLGPEQKKPVQKVSAYENSGIKQRNPILVFIFSFLTLGIYGIYWTVSTTNELRKNTKSAPNPWLLLLFLIPLVNIFVSFYYLWKYSKAINELTGFSNVSLFILWIILAPAGMILAQVQLNKKAYFKVKSTPSVNHQINQQVAQQVAQKVPQTQKPKKGIIIILIAALVILLVFLALTFIFKQAIIDFFANLFG